MRMTGVETYKRGVKNGSRSLSVDNPFSTDFRYNFEKRKEKKRRILVVIVMTMMNVNMS